MTATIYFNDSGRLGREKICTKGTVDGQKEGKGLGGKIPFPAPFPPPSLSPNQTWPVE